MCAAISLKVGHSMNLSNFIWFGVKNVSSVGSNTYVGLVAGWSSTLNSIYGSSFCSSYIVASLRSMSCFGISVCLRSSNPYDIHVHILLFSLLT